MTPGQIVELARQFEVPTTMRDARNVDALMKLYEIAPENRTRLEEFLAHGIPHNILNAK